jgi:uncharacterized membrane protein
MKYRAYRKISAVILLGLIIGMGIAIFLNSVLLAALILGGGMVVNSFLKAQVSDLPSDERLQTVAEKAARMAFVISLPIMGLTTTMLLIAGDGHFYFLRSLGIVLGYATLVMLGVYLLAFYYFNKQSGG